jgi:hypothetical protein
VSSRLTARPVTGPAPVVMPREFDPRLLARRALQVIAILGVLVAVVLLAPGLGDVRAKL